MPIANHFDWQSLFFTIFQGQDPPRGMHTGHSPRRKILDSHPSLEFSQLHPLETNMAAHSVAVVILVLCVLPGAMSWSLPAATRLPSLRRQPGHAMDLCMQASNAEQALARLQQQKQAKISLSKFESYTVRLKKPMGLVFEENAVATKGVFVAAVNKEATNPGNFEGWGFDQITLRDQLLRVDDMQGKVSDARCLDFDRAIALIAESPSMEMELTFAATGGAI